MRPRDWRHRFVTSSGPECSMTTATLGHGLLVPRPPPSLPECTRWLPLTRLRHLKWCKALFFTA